MRKNRLYKLFLSCSIIFQLVNCQAQFSFHYRSALSDIKSAGIYKISLPPEIVAKSGNELKDIRIFDNKGNQVPYVLKSEKPEFVEKNFIEFPILDVKREADKLTHIVIQNKAKRNIDELLLIIKNTAAERMVTLSGSDDQKQWFVIKEHITLGNVFIQEQDRFVHSLNFPTSTYKYFDLIINGKDLLPVNITKVGIYEGVSRNGMFINIPTPSIIQKDSSNKQSYITLVFNDSYLVNKLELQVEGPKFYKRHLTIRNEESNKHSANDYMLSSGTAPSYIINIRSHKIALEVENQDNPPVTIKSVKAYQLNKYLLAYLEPANKYELAFGDSTVMAPKYDLEYFKDSLNTTTQEASLGSITKTGLEKSTSVPTGGKSMLTLWIVIVSVLALLIILTFRMTKDIANKNNDENRNGG